VGLQSFTDEVALNEGGLAAAESVVEETIGAEEMDEVREEWHREELKDTFQQLYLGQKLYEKLEGEAPDIETTGFIYDEEPLITTEALRDLLDRFSVGILTGRPAAEADIAINRVGLEDLSEDLVFTMDDWDGSKPDPDALEELATRMEAESLVFVGDSLDDIRTAVNAQQEDDDREYYAIGVLSGGLSGEEGRIEFELEGADEVVEDVNDIPGIIDER
jgi:HAD superfamily phosphatase